METPKTKQGIRTENGIVLFEVPGDPQTYRLQFNLNELADAEELITLNLLRAIFTWPNLSGQQIRGLLYALLRAGMQVPKGNTQATLEDAGAVFTKAPSVVLDALREALIVAGFIEMKEPAPPAV